MSRAWPTVSTPRHIHELVLTTLRTPRTRPLDLWRLSLFSKLWQSFSIAMLWSHPLEPVCGALHDSIFPYFVTRAITPGPRLRPNLLHVMLLQHSVELALQPTLLPFVAKLQLELDNHLGPTFTEVCSMIPDEESLLSGVFWSGCARRRLAS